MNSSLASQSFYFHRRARNWRTWSTQSSRRPRRCRTVGLFRDEQLPPSSTASSSQPKRVSGLRPPQSASGQTPSSPVSTRRQLGYHKQGFPNSAMLEIIREHSLFLQLTHAGVQPVTFATPTRTSFRRASAGSRGRLQQWKRPGYRFARWPITRRVALSFTTSLIKR